MSTAADRETYLPQNRYPADKPSVLRTIGKAPKQLKNTLFTNVLFRSPGHALPTACPAITIG